MTEPNSLIVVGKASLALRDVLQSIFDKPQQDWVNGCLAEFSQVGAALAVAFVSMALDRAPTDPEVQEYLRSIVEDPAAPARMRRLLTEAFNSPSIKRRKRLAAVFFAGPRIVTTENERDRLDMLCAVLLDEDVAALKALSEYFNSVPLEDRDAASAKVFFYAAPDGEWVARARALERDGPKTAPLVVYNLQAAGCVEISQSIMRKDIGANRSVRIYSFAVSPLGRFFSETMQHELLRAELT